MTPSTTTTTTPRYHRALETVNLLAHAALSATLLGRWVRRVDDWADVALAALVVPAVVAAVDVVSGIVHFLADRFGSLETPLLGPNVLRSFREHHVDQQAMTKHDFISTSGDLGLLTVPTLAAALWLFDGDSRLGRVALAGAVAATTVGLLTSQIHKWAHAEHAPRVVRWLQRRGVILRPERHAAHHRAPHDCAFSITTGWSNGLLDRTQVLLRFERAVRARYPARP